ncbi:MAG: ThuA domain-containing protein [Chitinophagaceae bacterium]|nr:ThuA domain-containing protein [Chitinophagaceae bacterium]MCW5925724.1 ThuA domain-containing protein [Chitinophagaceae bacterium]
MRLLIKPWVTFLATGAFFMLLFSCSEQAPKDDQPRRLELLFLGHKSKHHNSEQLAEILMQEYFKKGINISYTTDPDNMLDDDFSLYDGLILYANHDSITPEQNTALLNFISSGKGFIPLHCASWCFRNSPEAVALIGGQFKTHQYDSFPAVLLKPEHPVLKDVPAFETEDETYVHDQLADDIEVLTERVEGDHHEPYTWVKSHGRGRVFYTAYGHNEKTFVNPGFLQLVYNGIIWAVGDHAAALHAAYTMPEVIYEDAVIPNYEKKDPPPKFQHPLTPEESMKMIQVPVGFELKLFAAEPDIHKPIHMAWDERGRLWVAETVDYPNMVRENKKEGRDIIKILEDTDGDGKADKFTVFADSLNIPTSFVFVNGGIVVSQAPDFLFLKDTDGDDKADIRETIVSGWGTFDTHAGPSNLRYGPDNRIWGTVGYSGFRTVVGVDSVNLSQGLYALTTDGQSFEWLGNTSNNTWGLGFSEDYDAFLSTANNTHSAALIIPKRYLEKASLNNETGIEKIESHYRMHVATKNLRQVDVHNGFTSAAGHSLYTARKFPRSYWNRVAFVTEPTGRVIHKNIIEPDGAGFKEGEDGWNFVTSADEWFGPVQAEVGPDGNVWFLDWYNFIIQHNPTPAGFDNGKGNAHINPLRDSSKGRIYWVQPKQSKKAAAFKLDKKDKSALIKALSNDNMFWRTTAQRLLVENGDLSVVPDLIKLVRNNDVDAVGLNPAAVHALWTLHGLKALDNKDVLEAILNALDHPSVGVRKTAIQVIPPSTEVARVFLEKGLLDDENLQVMLQAILKTCDFPASDEFGKKLFDLSSKQTKATEDRWIQKGLYIASRVHYDGYINAARAAGTALQPELGKAQLIHRILMGNKIDQILLSKGTSIGSNQLPDFARKEIFATAKVDLKPGEEGPILAQGNSANGYSLYVDKGRNLFYQVNQEGKSTIIRSTEPVPAKFSFVITLLKDGTMQLFIDDKPAITGKTKGLFGISLRNNGLRFGQDRWSKGAEKAGNYPDNASLGESDLADGRVETLFAESVTIDLGKPDQVIVLKTIPHEMKFAQEQLRAKAGSVVEIILDNVDFMQHNFLLLSPGSTEKVGVAADKMAESPDGLKLEYIPQMPEVLYATPLVNPDAKFSLKFRAPDVPGRYPYICSYPGHWRIMKGILIVER